MSAKLEVCLPKLSRRRLQRVVITGCVLLIIIYFIVLPGVSHDDTVSVSEQQQADNVEPSNKIYRASESNVFDQTNTTNGMQETHVENAELKYMTLKDRTINYVDYAERDLHSGYIPTTVHYMWCGFNCIQFRDYMSMVSVLNQLRPDQVVIHYQNYPLTDETFYNQWLDDLIHQYPFLLLEPMSDSQAEYCSEMPERKIQIIMETLTAYGGFYINHNTWMLNYNHEHRLLDFEYAIESGTTNGFISLRKGLYQNGDTIKYLITKPSLKYQISSCGHVNHLFLSDHKPVCVVLSDMKYEDDFYPKDIWELDDAFGRAARELFYGTSKILKPQPSYETMVPNIGHMIWLGGGEIDFLFYLSVLSVLYVLEVDTLYIHGNLEPVGKYWQQVKRKARVQYIERSLPIKVYQGEIDNQFYSLMSDVIRADIMVHYGGIYTDTDAIWVKTLSNEERGYEAVASFDWVDWAYPFPDEVNMGISYGKRGAPFWQLFQDSMRTLHNEIPGFTGVHMPYKLLEKHPDLLRIDPHLSVICYEQRCHPTWVKDYHNVTIDHITDNSITNWREDVHAFHWTFPNPPEFTDINTLVDSNSMFGEIGKFVLEKAGLLRLKKT